MFSALDIAKILEITPRAIEDLKSLDSLPEETPTVLVTLKQRLLLGHPFIKSHSHAKDHIPYFTDEMCDTVDGVFKGLMSLSHESVFDIGKIHESITKMVHDISEIVLEPKAWKGGRYLLQLKLRLKDAVPSRSVVLPSTLADKVFLYRRHSNMAVHFMVTDSEMSWKPFVSTTDTLIVQVWLGTPSAVSIESGTMYASDRFPDEVDPSSTNSGILFKIYKDEEERKRDAEEFICGVRTTSVTCLIDPVVYQRMVLKT